MRVNYTLPGMLPEASRARGADAAEQVVEPFGAQLQRLRAPDFTDWRALLRLDAPPPGLAGFGPPPAPQGIEWRDGVSERAWWRGLLRKHAAASDVDPRVERMLAYLQD